jgi:CubicO group peptidase (beta-lactamase class C family)
VYVELEVKVRTVIHIFTVLGVLSLALRYQPATSAYARNMQAQSAAQPDYAAIDAYLQSELQAMNMPGAALAIVHGDQLVHVKTYGIADPSGRAVTPDTPFILASVSKSFTALAVMQLVEAGKIELDTPVQHYLSWFQMADPAASQAITVRMLLNHTSGLPGQAGFLIIRSDDQSAGALEQHVRSLSTVQLDRAPGATYEYSNANYDILGLLVQTVAGQPYETYIQTHIFAPLGMSQSFTSRSDAAAHGLAAGYQHMLGFPVAQPWPYPRAMLPSGFLISSAQDLSHFIIAQLNDGQYQAQSILSPQGIAAMHTGTVPVSTGGSYGMGWVDLTIKGTHIVAHDGDSYNYHTSIYLLPESKWGLALLMNGSNAMYFARMEQLPLNLTGILVGALSPAQIQSNPILLMNELYRNSLVFAFLLAVVAIWTGLRLRRWSRRPESRPRGIGRIAYLILPLAFFLWQVWLFLFSLPQAMGGYPLPTLFAFRPDLIGLAVVLAVFAFGWGIYFEIRAVRALMRSRAPLTQEGQVNSALIPGNQ